MIDGYDLISRKNFKRGSNDLPAVLNVMNIDPIRDLVEAAKTQRNVLNLIGSCGCSQSVNPRHLFKLCTYCVQKRGQSHGVCSCSLTTKLTGAGRQDLVDAAVPFRRPVGRTVRLLMV